MVLHHWSGIQDAKQLWHIVNEMDWREIDPSARVNKQFKYMSWYDAYFKDIYSIEAYHTLMGV